MDRDTKILIGFAVIGGAAIAIYLFRDQFSKGWEDFAKKYGLDYVYCPKQKKFVMKKDYTETACGVGGGTTPPPAGTGEIAGLVTSPYTDGPLSGVNIILYDEKQVKIASCVSSGASPLNFALGNWPVDKTYYIEYNKDCFVKRGIKILGKLTSMGLNASTNMIPVDTQEWNDEGMSGTSEITQELCCGTPREINSVYVKAHGHPDQIWTTAHIGVFLQKTDGTWVLISRKDEQFAGGAINFDRTIATTQSDNRPLSQQKSFRAIRVSGLVGSNRTSIKDVYIVVNYKEVI